MDVLELVILDFDGTFTDVEREAIPFLDHYRRGLERIVGRPLEGDWQAAVETVRADPDQHGFRFDGRIVAPSHADPYILSSCVSQLILADAKIEPSPADLEQLFHESYRHADTVFRPDARDVAYAVLELGVPVYVVSNSRTDNVIAKLKQLDASLLSRLEVRGDARKFHLVEPETPDARFEAVPKRLDVPNLARPVYLRRGRYFEALDVIWRSTGAQPASTLICGDIFELDLALPQTLGARVHQVGRDDTPAWEREVVVSRGGSFSTTLSGVLDPLRAV